MLTDMIGARVGNWYVETQIGCGALGPVYAARGYDDPARRAAVKILADPAARDPAFAHKFAGELLALRRLDHPNVAGYFDGGVHAGHAYVATELAAGTDAAKLLEGGRRPWAEVLAVAVQVARALGHGHHRNLLHRDLKPAHLILTPDGTVKVLGFGLAKVVPPPLAAAPPLGSAAYLPPETASGKPPTRRSDFYSLGGVLYTLLTGRPPFAAATVVELTHKQCYALPERPGMLVPDVPPELDEFVCGLLAKDPARRPASARAILDELERVRGKLERRGATLPWPAKLRPDTAETPALPPDASANDPTESGGRRGRRFAGYSVALAAVVAALVYGLAFAGPSADDLWAAAAPLVASDDPADWDRAWDEYLDPLSRKYPDRYTDDVAAAKARIRDRKELRRAVADGAKADPRSDAERGYLRGLRLAQAGEAEAARTTWRAVATAFAPVESEARWVGLARAGLETLDRTPLRGPQVDRRPFEAAVAHAAALAAGKPADAAAAFRALEELARDDPPALALVRAARGK